MTKNPFTTLGVNENVTQNELFEAYKELRYIHSKKRFEQGAEAEAAEKLEEIEVAYAEATDILRSRFAISNYYDALPKAESIENKEDEQEDEEYSPNTTDGSRSYKDSDQNNRSYKTSTLKGKDKGCVPLLCGAECCCECLCEGACESLSC